MNINDLFLCPICKDIPEKEREVFLRNLQYSVMQYKKGSLLANQGDVVDALYILLKGSVKTEMISESGTVMNIEIVKSPNPLAPAFLFAENNLFPVDVVALEDCELIVIYKNSVLTLLSTNEAFLQSYITFNSNRTNFLSERIKLLSIKTIKGKLAQYILGRAENKVFTLGMNQTELSEYFGIARPSLARSLSEMVNDQVIELNKKEGKVLNIDKLKEFIVQ